MHMKMLLNKCFVALLLTTTIIPSTNAWIIVLNGTSSSGKTTLARRFQRITRWPTSYLSEDIEEPELVKEILKEPLAQLGYDHDDEKTDFREWLQTLPKEIDVEKMIDENALNEATEQRVVEKARKLGLAGTNVIIDTALGEKKLKLLASQLSGIQTYFVLVYAPIDTI